MAILDLIFPKNCLECGHSGKYICESCFKKIRPGGLTSKTAYSIFRYEGVIRKAIIALKYKFSTEITQELTEVCVKNLDAIRFPLPTTLVPIPLHWYRKNVRGFNQSEEVGKLLARKMNWRYIPDLLIRTKSTVPQAHLTGSARRENLYGVFAINPSISIPEYPNIILFDDVLTTGSTLLEASKVLREGGVKRIFCLTIAK